MICHCLCAVEPQRLRKTFTATWLTGTVTSEQPTLQCFLCDNRPPVLTSRKEERSRLEKLFRRKTTGELEETNVEDLFMCLTCTRCFCNAHAKNHMEDHNVYPTPSNTSANYHRLYLLVPGGTKTMNGFSSYVKHRTVFPTYHVEGIEGIRESGLLPLEKENTFEFVLVNGGQGWTYNVWCAECSEKPAFLRAVDYSESNKNYVYLKRIGDTVAELLCLFYEGVRFDIPGEEARSTPSKGYTGGHGSYTHSYGSPSCNRSYGHDMDVHGSDTSSAFGRNSRAELEALVSAHIAGIENLRNTCYFNSVLQCILKCSSFVNPLLSLHEDELPGPLTRRLYDIARHLREETIKDIQKRTLYGYARKVLQCVCEIAPVFAEDEQQDSQELFLSMINGVADEFDKGKSEERKKKDPRLSFEGAMRTEVVCKRCESCFSREEVFMALSVPVEDTIERGLSKLFWPIDLRGKDQYACETCFKRLSRAEQEKHNAAIKAENERKAKLKKTTSGEEKRGLNCVYSDARVSTSISRMGGTIALHLLRFHCEGQYFQKITKNVAFPLTLDLSRYVSTDTLQDHETTRSLHFLEKRFPSLHRDTLLHYLDLAHGDPCRAERMLTESGECDRPNDTGAGSAGPRDDVPPDVSTSSVSQQTSCGVSPAGISESFATPTDGAGRGRDSRPALRRELVGIVTHRGSLHGGHYVAYVRDMQQPSVWFRCDDEDVERVDKDHVLRCQAEVYMLFYE